VVDALALTPARGVAVDGAVSPVAKALASPAT
jgi:hypothetical protein